MSGRIVLFGATGYTGDLTARALVDRGVRPVLAARNRGSPGRRWPPSSAGSRRGSPTSPPPRRCAGLAGRGDVLVSTVGPFMRAGRPRRRGRGRRGRALPRLDRRGPVHPLGVRAPRAGRRGGGLRARHRVRLRLGPGQPRRSARAARGGRAGDERRHRLLRQRQRRGRHRERRHAGVGARADARAGLRLPGRAARHRAGGPAAARIRPRRTARRGRDRRELRGLHARAAAPGPARRERLSRVGRVAVARRPGRVGGHVAAGPRPGRAGGRRRDPAPARPRIDGRAGRRGAVPRRVGRSSPRRSTPAGPASPRSSCRASTRTTSRPRCWPGARRPRRTADCTAPARSGRSTRSASRRSCAAAPRPASRAFDAGRAARSRTPWCAR